MDTPTAPFIAFLESDAGDNENWIGEGVGDDPENITWTNFTEGTEAIVLTKISSFVSQAVTGVQAQHLGAGVTYDQKYGNRFYQFTITGIVETWAAMNLIDKFFMQPNKTTGSSFKRPHMIFKQATDVYKEFTHKESDGALEYCPCNALMCRLQWNGASPLTWQYVIQGFSVMR